MVGMQGHRSPRCSHPHQVLYYCNVGDNSAVLLLQSPLVLLLVEMLPQPETVLVLLWLQANAASPLELQCSCVQHL